MSDEAKPAVQDSTTTAPSAVAPVETKPAETTEKSLVTNEPVKAEASEAKTDTPKPSEEKPAVPEKYELKIPEGSTLDPSVVESVAQFAKEHKLSQEQAQAVLEKQNSVVTDLLSKQQVQVQELNNTWYKELEADKEIGGEKLKENGHLAYKAGVKVFGEQFMEKIIAAKLNQYPDFFRGLVKLGKESQDDTFVNGGGNPAQKKSIEERLYPGSKQ